MQNIKMKNKLIKNVDVKIWQKLKLLAVKNDLTLAEMLKIIIEFFIENNNNRSK